jgi:hypothetical protein
MSDEDRIQEKVGGINLRPQAIVVGLAWIIDLAWINYRRYRNEGCETDPFPGRPSFLGLIESAC